MGLKCQIYFLGICYIPKMILSFNSLCSVDCFCEAKSEVELTTSTIAIDNILAKKTHDKIRSFNTKKNAIDYIEENNFTISLFSIDLNIDGSKEFYTADYDTIFNVIYGHKKDNKTINFYENYEEYNKIKLPIDVDISEAEIGDRNRDELFSERAKEIITLLNLELKNQFDIKDPQILILRSKYTKKKLSFHIIYINVVFYNILHLKYFFMDLKSSLINKKLIDPAIYKIGCYRTLWSSKMNVDNQLEFAYGINYTKTTDKQLFLDSLLTNIPVKYHFIKLDIETKLNKPIIHVKNFKKCELTNNQLNIKNPLSELVTYINLIDPKRSDDYWDWIKLGICLFNSNSLSFDLWTEWSKNSSKCDYDMCVYKWNSFHKGTLSMGTIKYMARIDNPELYNKLHCEQDKRLFVPDLVINRRYLIEFVDQLTNYFEGDNLPDNYKLINQIRNWYLNDDAKTLSILSNCDTAKTSLIKKIVSTFEPQKILWISYRQTLTYDIEGNFGYLGFNNYMDRVYDADKLICQIDSLPNILDYIEIDPETFEGDVPSYDLVIIDESESIINYYGNAELKQQRDIFELQKNIIFNSKKILALDGDFNNRSYEYLNFYGKQIIVENINKGNTKHFILSENLDYFEIQILYELYRGKNIIISTMSSTYGKMYYDRYIKMGFKATLHISKSGNKQKQNLRNVNSFWTLYQIVIYSNTVEAGVNCDIPHFYKLFCILSTGSCSERSLIQMTYRVRKFVCNEVLVYTNGLKYSEIENFYTFKEVEQYVTELNGSKLSKSYILDPKTHKMIFKTNMDLYDKMVIYNEQENQNKQPHYFIPYLIKLLKEKGHKVTFDMQINKPNKYMIDNVNKMCLDMGIESKFKYNKKNKTTEEIDRMAIMKAELFVARNISKYEFDFLLDKQRSNKATEDDKIHIEKYLLMYHFGIDKMDVNFINCFYRKTNVLYNLINLIDTQNIEHYIQNETETIYDVQKKKERCDMINEMIKLLGYNNIFDDKKIIREEFNANFNKVLLESKFFKDIAYSNLLFELPKKKKINSIKSFLGFINSILIDYGLNLKMKKKKIRFENKLINQYSYVLSFVNNINEFINFKIIKNHKFKDLNKLFNIKTNKWNYLLNSNDNDYYFI